MTHVYVRDAASAEIDEAHEWYDAQRPGLGDKFLRCVQSTFGKIAKHPELYPVVRNTTRRVVVVEFPYVVYFRLTAGVAVITAVMHGRRDPRRWHSRQ